MTRLKNYKQWEITPEKVKSAISRIIDTGKPRKLILFGSYVKNTTSINSDVDFLVITGDHITNPRRESVRIRRELRDISMPMDILVLPESRWNELKDVSGMIYNEAKNTGKVVYDSTR